MRDTAISFLCGPENHEDLRRSTESGQEFLVGVQSGQKFPIQDGIPVFEQTEQITGDNKKYQSLYDRIARWYDISERVGSIFMGTRQDKVRREIVQGVPVRPGGSFLEISIGTGLNLRYLPRQDATFFGLDLSMGMLRQCQRNLRNWKIEADLALGNAERLPFKDARFDTVFHFGGINFFNDKVKAIQEMIRVAKPGAWIFIGDETADLARQYEKSRIPVLQQAYQADKATSPLALIPPEMEEARERTFLNHKLYMISFRKPQ